MYSMMTLLDVTSVPYHWIMCNKLLLFFPKTT